MRLVLILTLALLTACGESKSGGADSLAQRFPVATAFGSYTQFALIECGGDSTSCRHLYSDELGEALLIAYGAQPFDFKQCALTLICLDRYAYETAYRGY
jgi:hypothetical protein